MRSIASITYIALLLDNIVVLIDYGKAFNNISQVQMFEILSEMGFPEHLFALLELSALQLTVNWHEMECKPQ